MRRHIRVPPFRNDPPEQWADFAEYSALTSLSGSCSFNELVNDAKLPGSDRGVDGAPEFSGDDGNGTVDYESFAEAVFDEIDNRRKACGGIHYPFNLSERSVRTINSTDNSLYTFLALLSWFGTDAGPTRSKPEKLFEEISAKAAEGYLGGPREHVKSLAFGHPRGGNIPKGFRKAVAHLCKSCGEGRSHPNAREGLGDKKDAGLDVVAWRDFDDEKTGKLIIFGQCATGQNWKEKLTELQPDKWCQLWLAEGFLLPVTRSYFVPHVIENNKWKEACTMGGLLYDRCRIVSLAHPDTPDGADTKVWSRYRNAWSAWTAHVLNGEKTRSN